MKLFQNFLRDEQGQDLVEYTLLMAAMALATGAVILPMRTQVSIIWTSTSTLINSAATGS